MFGTLESVHRLTETRNQKGKYFTTTTIKDDPDQGKVIRCRSLGCVYDKGDGPYDKKTR